MDDLEKRLISYEVVGKIRISKADEGWHCNLELPAPAGCDARVRSDFDHMTPTAALDCMESRLHNIKTSLKALPG